MPLTNYEVEIKLKLTKNCVLGATGNNSTEASPNNIIFTIKEIKLHVPIVTLLAKDN